MTHDERLVEDHEKKFEKTENELEDIKKSVNRIERQLTVKKATNGLRTKQMVNDIESLKEKDTTIAEKIETMSSDISEIKGILKGSSDKEDVSRKNLALIISGIALVSSALIGIFGFIL